jgi:hypothetical protein
VISHWIATIVLLSIVGGGMALAWPLRKKRGARFGADVNGPGHAIDEGHHGHAHGDGFSSTDY